MILINERGVFVEGVLKFIVSNAEDFETTSDAITKVKTAVANSHWTPAYSRRLAIEGISFAGPASYCDHTMLAPAPRYFLHGIIANRRPDIAARHSLCRLVELTDATDAIISHDDRSPLKAVSLSSYEQTIWPEETGAFDLLSLDAVNWVHVYLHSGKDFSPRAPIITSPGMFFLKYAVLAEGFSPISFIVRLVITGNRLTTTATVMPS